jgi:hypothetical protein
MFIVAFIIHISFLLWAVLDILPNPLGVTDRLLDDNLHTRLSIEAMSLFMVLYLAYMITPAILSVIIGIPMGLLEHVNWVTSAADRILNLFSNFLEFISEKHGWA